MRSEYPADSSSNLSLCARTSCLPTMYVVKIKHGETLRRIVLDDVFTYAAL